MAVGRALPAAEPAISPTCDLFSGSCLCRPHRDGLDWWDVVTVLLRPEPPLEMFNGWWHACRFGGFNRLSRRQIAAERRSSHSWEYERHWAFSRFAGESECELGKEVRICAMP